MAAGAYGRFHDPTGEQTITLFFSSTLAFKAWTTSLIGLLALFQLVTALRIYGRLSWPPTVPPWLGDVHRISGLLAFMLSLPVAFHCLWALGFEPDATQTRRFVHSLLGCLFYGAFAAKVIAVKDRRLPGWVLPTAGGAVFTTLTGIWLTSSLWYFRNVGGL